MFAPPTNSGRCTPFDGGTEIELRRVFEAEDFGSNATAEMMERDANLRRQIAEKK